MTHKLIVLMRTAKLLPAVPVILAIGLSSIVSNGHAEAAVPTATLVPTSEPGDAALPLSAYPYRVFLPSIFNLWDETPRPTPTPTPQPGRRVRFFGDCLASLVSPCEEMSLDPAFTIYAQDGMTFNAVWTYFTDPLWGESAILFPAFIEHGCVIDSLGRMLWCGHFSAGAAVFFFERVSPFVPAMYLAASDETTGERTQAAWRLITTNVFYPMPIGMEASPQ